MKVKGISYRTLWVKPGDPGTLQVIDQRFLPHEFVVEELKSSEEVARAIREMHVRGAPLIGAAAAYGVYFALRETSSGPSSEERLQEALRELRASRPTAVNLEWAIQRELQAIQGKRSAEEKIEAAFKTAGEIADEDVRNCQKIGEHGLKLIQEIAARKKGRPVNILTHCNAGWLACVDWGTATAPIYLAFDRDLPVHVWVEETRPRNQGASLTAWELLQHGVPHTVVVDSAAGHLMQQGLVDLVLVGTDRTTRTGDVANKIGTYLKALAANAHGIPFYAAVPSSSIDWSLREGVREIPIEERSPDEVKYIQGLADGKIKKVLLTPEKSPAKNYAFDVTPRRLVTGLITERGISEASEAGLLRLFPEKGEESPGREEGVVKFQCRWIEAEPPSGDEAAQLVRLRNRLFKLGLIGVYRNGVAFGNVSVRLPGSEEFIISGTQTGGIAELDRRHLTRVTSFDLERNSLTCRGEVKASSESLTHAALYSVSSEINAILHVHHPELWKRLLRQVPATAEGVPYGTPEMAREVARLFRDSDLAEKRILVMAGHEEGIIAFGKDLEEAASVLLSHFEEKTKV